VEKELTPPDDPRLRWKMDAAMGHDLVSAPEKNTDGDDYNDADKSSDDGRHWT
jgi:hypothetical protein